MSEDPTIQMISNLVVHDGSGQILLARYNPSGEIDDDDADIRWWLPAHELDAYQHPDEAAKIAAEEITGLAVDSIELSKVQSFRGRRGWHVSFDYLVQATGQPGDGPIPARWFERTDLPAMMHGNWERDTIEAVLS